MGIPMLKIRRSWDRLIFNMGIPVLVWRHLYIETAPRWWHRATHNAGLLSVSFKAYSNLFKHTHMSKHMGISIISSMFSLLIAWWLVWYKVMANEMVLSLCQVLQASVYNLLGCCISTCKSYGDTMIYFEISIEIYIFFVLRGYFFLNFPAILVWEIGF